MKLDTMMEAIEVLARERGVAVDTILDAFANALVAAYKRSPGAAEEARVTIDPDSGEVIVYAQELDEDGNVVSEWEDTPEGEAFGRIAAQSFKQVMQHKLREAKREHVFEMYEGREGDLVTGLVQQVDYRSVILDLGDAEAILPGSERIPFERLERGNRVKALILEVRNEAKGAQIVVSRSHPDLVRRLLELEVPELTDGTVEIVNIAREPGHRTKIAVISHDPNVDPKGACVGARGSRVRQVVNELRGEKVDVVQWRDDIGQFIAEALGPAKVKEVHIDEETKTRTPGWRRGYPGTRSTSARIWRVSRSNLPRLPMLRPPMNSPPTRPRRRRPVPPLLQRRSKTYQSRARRWPRKVRTTKRMQCPPPAGTTRANRGIRT